MKLHQVWHCPWSDDPSNPLDWECVDHLRSENRDELVNKLIAQQDQLVHNSLSKENWNSPVWEDDMSLSSLKEAMCDNLKIGWWQITEVNLEIK
jgi:hypothetical protein